MKIVNVESWEEFNGRLGRLRSDGTEFLFRGQEDSNWELVTTLERAGREEMKFANYYSLISRIRPQVESFTDMQWPIPEYQEVERSVQEYDRFSLKMTCCELPAYAYMAYLRHHGFPSPLLDWTRSPYVAAFFAFRGSVSNPKGRPVSIYAFSPVEYRVRGTDMPMIFPLGRYVKTHPRHFLQQSEYTMCLRFVSEDGWRFAQYGKDPEASAPQQGFFWKFNIPHTEGRKVLRELDEHNLNALSLFGSDESLMQTLTLRELLLP